MSKNLAQTSKRHSQAHPVGPRAFGALTTLLAFLVQPSIYSQSTLPVQWSIAQGGNDHWYQIVHMPGQVDWAAADSLARLRGGLLATVSSLQEGAFIFALADTPQFWVQEAGPGSGNLGPWLGGYQPMGSPEPGGNWQWVSGEAFSHTNWFAGQPNNSGNENRLHMIAISPNRSPQWNDIDGTRMTAAYVVEWLRDPRGQSNSASGTLTINGVGASSNPGPHVQLLPLSRSLTFEWSGPPRMPYVLVGGSAAPCFLRLGCTGCLDLASLAILMDGTNSVGYYLFSLNASGRATQTLVVPDLPPGTPLTFQGLVMQPLGCPAVLTATHIVGT